METGGKQPLLLQLLQERRKFTELLESMYPEKGITPAVLRECMQAEARRRAAGARALPLHKVLVKHELLSEKEAADVVRKARASQESFVAPKDMEAFRKAQQEAGMSLERVLVKTLSH